jgi:hypothetical protein
MVFFYLVHKGLEPGHDIGQSLAVIGDIDNGNIEPVLYQPHDRAGDRARHAGKGHGVDNA